MSEFLAWFNGIAFVIMFVLYWLMSRECRRALDGWQRALDREREHLIGRKDQQ